MAEGGGGTTIRVDLSEDGARIQQDPPMASIPFTTEIACGAQGPPEAREEGPSGSSEMKVSGTCGYRHCY